jgi:DNA-binding CsgD family transcriptional regulator
MVQGEWSEARELAEITRVQGSPLERQMAVMILGNLAYHQGDAERAWAMVGELVPRGPDTEPEDCLFPYAIEMLRLATSLALDASDILAGRNWLSAHEYWLDWSGAIRGRAEANCLWTQLYLIDGDITQAEHAVQEAIALASSPRQPLALLTAHRVAGRVCLAQQHHADAESHFVRSMHLADACAAPYERARTLVDLAALLRSANRSREAAPLLEETRAIAVGLEAAPLIAAIDGLASDGAVDAPAPRLTAREREVLRLVAEGMTDAEVANRLSISPRTVGQHLQSIYNKLGVSSRTAATRIAIEGQLV